MAKKATTTKSRKPAPPEDPSDRRDLLSLLRSLAANCREQADLTRKIEGQMERSYRWSRAADHLDLAALDIPEEE